MSSSSSNLPPVRVRFAPSPTGLTHLGSARTALYNYLLAHNTGGQFILRFEDTDSKRYDPQAEDDLIDSLHWLGLQWDEGPDVGGPHAPYRQSERKAIYQEYAQQLIAQGDAFYCFCTPQELDAARKEQLKNKENPHYPGTCRQLSPEEAQARVDAGESHVVRFKMPKAGSTTVVDYLRGEITFQNENLDDTILIKSNGLAVYHLAAMVDDHLMGITHVFRGEEWVSTFPLHVRIYAAFGWQQPTWVHLSLFLKPEGKGKMSKRATEEMKQLTGKSIFVQDMEAIGYLPEAVVNWIALMGWSYDGETEFFTLEDLVEKFSIDKLNPSSAAINFKKLDHFNGLHIRSLTIEDLAQRIKPFFVSAGYQPDDETLIEIAPLIQPRLVTLDEAPTWAGFFFETEVKPEAADLIPKGLDAAQSLDAAQRARDLIATLPDFSHETAEQPMRDLAEELGIKVGQLFGVLRIALTAQQVSPPLLESMQIIGRDTVLQRLDQASSLLEKMA
ncbi:MAG: glutamate--tRNA ligase [Anaerolineales bacterium]|nr:glutamate--tRNA ligase [Anaerolineales bacterium]